MDASENTRAGWLDTSAALPFGSEATLSEKDVCKWRENGAVVVAGVLESSLVDSVLSFISDRCPPCGSAEAMKINDFGSGPHVMFPSIDCESFNEMTTHPRILKAVSQLLDVEEERLRLTQSDMWPKYGQDATGKQNNQDQRIHCDFPNHTLVHPPPWHMPEAVEMIIYMSDVDECAGATAVVPRDGDDDPLYAYERYACMPGMGTMKYVNNRTVAEEMVLEHDAEMAHFRSQLYAREKRVQYRKGHILFYRHDAWHRGTPLRHNSMRIVCNITYRRDDCEWISTLHSGWAWSIYSQKQTFERFLALASLSQRAVLGFPQPGHRYWTNQTIDAVERRFGPLGMDMTPYCQALEGLNSG